MDFLHREKSSLANASVTFSYDDCDFSMKLADEIVNLKDNTFFNIKQILPEYEKYPPFYRIGLKFALGYSPTYCKGAAANGAANP